mmetsp:Transcript_66996/g.161823  ORF Transcript_66996/g.161823 Transcript_66996/m.161823 type:complete len:236 (+) Transcript_66996:454-1161(+)
MQRRVVEQARVRRDPAVRVHEQRVGLRLVVVDHVAHPLLHEVLDQPEGRGGHGVLVDGVAAALARAHVAREVDAVERVHVPRLEHGVDAQPVQRELDAHRAVHARQRGLARGQLLGRAALVHREAAQVGPRRAREPAHVPALQQPPLQLHVRGEDLGVAEQRARRQVGVARELEPLLPPRAELLRAVERALDRRHLPRAAERERLLEGVVRRVVRHGHRRHLAQRGHPALQLVKG